MFERQQCAGLHIVRILHAERLQNLLAHAGCIPPAFAFVQGIRQQLRRHGVDVKLLALAHVGLAFDRFADHLRRPPVAAQAAQMLARARPQYAMALSGSSFRHHRKARSAS